MFRGLPEHDLFAKRIGRLVVQGVYVGQNRTLNNHKSKWVVKCDCGRYQVNSGATLRKAIEAKRPMKCHVCETHKQNND